MSGGGTNSDKSMTFEKAIAELEEIVRQLEKGELSLDESIDCFKRGVELAKYCGKRLDEAERSITMLIEGENGAISEKEMPL